MGAPGCVAEPGPGGVDDSDHGAEPEPAVAQVCARWEVQETELSGSLIGDLDGDGIVEVATGEGRSVVVRSAADGAVLRTVTGLGSTVSFSSVADVDDDGVRDLIVRDFWDSEVGVWLGPHAGETVAFEDAPVRFAVDPAPNGLSVRFGWKVLVEDIDQDDHPDVLISAPAEGEEACVGSERVRAFLGPVEPGLYGDDDADLRPFGDAPCIGDTMFRLGDDVIVGDEVGVGRYAVPIDASSEPVEELSAEGGTELPKQGWETGDGASWLLGRVVQRADGSRISLQGRTDLAAVPSWAHVFADSYSEEEGHRTHVLPVADVTDGDVTSWPVLIDGEGLFSQRFSEGDVDGDGAPEILIGTRDSGVEGGWALVRCAELR